MREAGSVEDIKRAFGYTIINKTLQEQDKVASQLRTAAMRDSGKGTELDIEV